jgi:hypothetical protein
MDIKDYQDLIEKTERHLQNHIGLMIADGIRFDGFGKAYIDPNPLPEFSTPVVMPLYFNTLALDGDDSHEAFEDEDGDNKAERWLEGQELMDGKILFLF